MAVRSNLGEVTVEMIKYIYSLLNTSLPEHFTSPEQVIYSTVISEESDFREYEKRYKKVEFPFAAITRQSNFRGLKSNSAIPSVDFFRTSFYNKDNIDEDGNLDRWRMLPAQLDYHVRVYDTNFNNLEMLCEQVLFAMSSKNLRWTFNSELLKNPDTGEGIEQLMTVFYEEAPVHGYVPDRDDKYKGRGYIYVLNFEPIVNTSLGYRENSGIIKSSIANIKHIKEDENFDEDDILGLVEEDSN